ncbi:MAG: hypothetical protein ABL974_23815, partial [Prosthecobacter sp.]
IDLRTITDAKTWEVLNAAATIEPAGGDGKSAVRLTAHGDSGRRMAGIALPIGVEFATGVIELDLKGKNLKQRSFLGVVFNVADNQTFEGIYFRPFNFRAAAPMHTHAVQYICWPDYTWEKLRKNKPGKFEAAIVPAPDPDGWFHARIVITEKQVQVFVNAAKSPSLEIERLTPVTTPRPTGLFVDVAEGQYANLKVTPIL